VVMERGRLAGMLTFREVLRVLARRQQEHRTGPTPPVAEIVVREVPPWPCQRWRSMSCVVSCSSIISATPP
jgi:hypothetical protein